MKRQPTLMETAEPVERARFYLLSALRLLGTAESYIEPDAVRHDPARSLAALREAWRDLEAAQSALVAGMRERGDTWARVGDALGVARQTAFERYRGLVQQEPTAVARSEASTSDDTTNEVRREAVGGDDD